MNTHLHDRAGLHGFGFGELFIAGVLVDVIEFENLITKAGDKIYGDRGASVGTIPAAPTGMHLGTGSTAAAKTGGGAAIGAYITGSNVGFQLGYPISATPGASYDVIYKATFGPGVAQNAHIREIGLVNQAITTNSVASAANTLARAVFGSDVDKSDPLAQFVVTWTHSWLGA